MHSSRLRRILFRPLRREICGDLLAIPVHDRFWVPGPWYSTMAPVPPLTVSSPATLRMISGARVSFGESIDSSPSATHSELDAKQGWKRPHTFGSSPSGQFTSKPDTNDLGRLQLPRKTSHDVDGVSTANTDSSHTETTGIGRVRVGTNEESTGESVVLEDNLVNDTGSGPPEANVVLCAGCGQEVVDLLVDIIGAGEILCAADLGLDKMVAVHRRRRLDLGHAGRHELQDGHLGGGVLASYAVGAELEVAGAALNLLVVRVVEMRVEDLLGKGERAVEALAHDAQVLAHLLVVDVVALLEVVHLDLAGQRSIADSGQLPPLEEALADAAEPGELLHDGWEWRMEWRVEEMEQRRKRTSEAARNWADN
jgi:hypothetical protein